MKYYIYIKIAYDGGIIPSSIYPTFYLWAIYRRMFAKFLLAYIYFSTVKTISELLHLSRIAINRNFPDSSAVKSSPSSAGDAVRPQVEELRSHMSCGQNIKT